MVFAILTGCAMPPSGDDQASALRTGTQSTATSNAANTGRGPARLAAPLAYDSGLNALPPSASNSSDTFSLANAESITAGPDVSDFEQQGRASWYGRGFHGRKTASGESYDMHALTAAHRTLPLASWVRVTNEANHKTVVVKINDRGPYARGHVIDLSYAAAAVLGMRGAGVGKVKIGGLTQQEARAAARDQSLASINPSSTCCVKKRAVETARFFIAQRVCPPHF
ncbi:Rare lipoprotein A [Candidatus Burkholderia crenata]|nr:Rare lipoprotein A [Candidatus Burkholderia crenata]